MEHEDDASTRSVLSPVPPREEAPLAPGGAASLPGVDGLRGLAELA